MTGLSHPIHPNLGRFLRHAYYSSADSLLILQNGPVRRMTVIPLDNPHPNPSVFPVVSDMDCTPQIIPHPYIFIVLSCHKISSLPNLHTYVCIRVAVCSMSQQLRDRLFLEFFCLSSGKIDCSMRSPVSAVAR